MKLCGFEAGLDQPLFLIAGPDTLESEQLCIEVAGHLKERAARLSMPYIFKGSFDKANRSSGASYRGPGMEEGLRILEQVRRQVGVPVLTDVHEDTPLAEVAAGFVGNGCVGAVHSNGTSVCVTGRSSRGQSGSPVARSNA
jgi:2-dehydro-3-deoxyphosphooctonate aldolase (KDO 8-P synthase)